MPHIISEEIKNILSQWLSAIENNPKLTNPTEVIARIEELIMEGKINSQIEIIKLVDDLGGDHVAEN